MKILKRIKSNKGFAGHTHALSTLSLFLLLATLNPVLIYKTLLHTENIFIFLASIFFVVGFCLFPDFDNTKSTVISNTGIIGILFSHILRGISDFIFNLTKTKYDSDEGFNHRWFWHTLISAVLVGSFVFATTIISVKVKIPYLNKTYKIGTLISVLWLMLCIKLTFAGLFGKILKNKGKYIFSLIITILSFGFSYYVLVNTNLNKTPTWWIGVFAGIGYALHLIEDTLTAEGAPLFFPIKIKGKRWFKIRIIGIQSGGIFEKIILLPFFSVLTIYGITMTVLYLFR